MGTGLCHLRCEQSDADDSDSRIRTYREPIKRWRGESLPRSDSLARSRSGRHRNQIDPGAQNDDNLYEVPEDELKRRGIGSLPTTLSEAVDALEENEVIKKALGDEYADYYIQVKREEWRNYHLSISQWETDNYLEIY